MIVGWRYLILFPMLTIATTVRVWAWTTAHMDPTTRRSTSTPRVTWAKKMGDCRDDQPEISRRGALFGSNIFESCWIFWWKIGRLEGIANTSIEESSRTSLVESKNFRWQRKLVLNNSSSSIFSRPLASPVGSVGSGDSGNDRYLIFRMLLRTELHPFHWNLGLLHWRNGGVGSGHGIWRY